MIKTMNIAIWGREFDLDVSYDCHSDERVPEFQKEAIRSFDKHPEWLEKAKTKVEEFCSKSVLQDPENEKKDNIFSYVKPHYIYVTGDTESPKVVLLLKYRYELEHGLAVQFLTDGSSVVDLPDNLF